MRRKLSVMNVTKVQQLGKRIANSLGVVRMNLRRGVCVEERGPVGLVLQPRVARACA